MSDETTQTALVARDPDRYRIALAIAHQLNAEFKNRRALRIFNALSRSDVLPAAALGAVGVTVAGLAAALWSYRRRERHIAKEHAAPDQPQNRQLLVISETAIQIRPAQLSVQSRIRVVEQET